MASMIAQTNHLTKKHKASFRVQDLDLQVPEGSLYGFLGPNGAGKSTTLKMLLGLVHPTSGSIELFGERVTTKNRLSLLRNIGSLIEAPSYYGHLTGEENLKIVQTLKGVPQSQIAAVLDIVRLTEQKHKKVSQYSLGMKQRLGIACALLGFPKLLILDEPSNGLDPAGIQEMRTLICALPKQYGMTVLMSSHLLSEVEQIADTIGVISEGALVFQGEMRALHDLRQSSLLVRTLDNARAQQLLQANGIACAHSERYLRLPLLEDDAAARCVQALVAQGIPVVRMQRHSMTLEDIFLDLTGSAVSL